MRILVLLGLTFLSACAPGLESTDKKPDVVLKEASFAELPGWGNDDLKTFIPAFTKSCERILKNDPSKKLGPLEAAGTYGDWQPICRSFVKGQPRDLKSFIELRFRPYLVTADGKAEGLFTGYYEASLKGARKPGAPYSTPLYQRPDDLVMVQLGDFRDDLKGRRIAGRVIDGRLRPFEDRPEIVSNPPKDYEPLVWVDDAVDAFFVQIQGSGVVQLNDGSVMRIGYAGQNGHPYYAIGRELIARGALTKETVSLQTIRAWLEANPSQADEIMNTNASYVFFKELKGEGPIGGEGLPLTAGRSLAVDRSLLAYGLPLWADIEAPIEGAGQINKLMVAQDTGGAIRGPVRGDVFWGYGDRAETLAGPMKSKGATGCYYRDSDSVDRFCITLKPTITCNRK